MLEESNNKYDELIRMIFRITELTHPKEDKIILIKNEYQKINDKDIEKNGLFITALQTLEQGIDESKPDLTKLFEKGIKLLLDAEIINTSTYQEVLGISDSQILNKKAMQRIERALSKQQRVECKKFLVELIKEKINPGAKKETDNIVDRIIIELKQINFGDFDMDINPDFVIFGSSKNGFYTEGSDYDITLTLKHVNERELLNFFQKKAKDQLNPLFKENEFEIFKVMYDNVRVPLVDIIVNKNLKLNFSVNNRLAIYNTKLLKAYARFDTRCHMLGLLVKIWAKTHQVVAKRDYLNSYAYLLMVINFLQTMKNPILPTLQRISQQHQKEFIQRSIENGREQHFATRIDFENDPQVFDSIKAGQQLNKATDAELLKKFFKFYSQPSKFENIKLSVREGKHLPRSKTEEDNRYLYSIEDPFDPFSNPGRRLKKDTIEAERVLKLMKISYELLRENKIKEVFQPIF